MFLSIYGFNHNIHSLKVMVLDIALSVDFIEFLLQFLLNNEH